eukprot:GHVL01040016.1.p1 GENE.GHVL01040016.1~~GHVL01040016.1.p1  ORF type:complete len:249 (-),score=31.95 GHVL01040016.1:180-926(-)
MKCETSQKQSKLTSLSKFLLDVVKAGPIPRHVGFIMDGNRRYAADMKSDVLQGHQFGFETLNLVLEWCLYLGITEISIFAFSIENFNRSSEEVAALMDLTEQKLTDIKSENNFLSSNKIKINVVGNRDLLSKSLINAIDDAQNLTNFSNGEQSAILNICFAYTSTFELNRAFSEMAKNNEKEVFDKYLMCTKVDLLIRTSGETRISDYLTWQVREGTLICFLFCYWPSLSLAKFLSCLLRWQLLAIFN